MKIAGLQTVHSAGAPENAAPRVPQRLRRSLPAAFGKRLCCQNLQHPVRLETGLRGPRVAVGFPAWKER